MWMRCVYGLTWNGQTCVNDHQGGYDWKTALLGAKQLNESAGFANHHDWRVPNIKELATVVNWESKEYLNSEVFPAIPQYVGFWSSSPDAFTINGAWMIESGTSQMTTINKNLYYNVSLFVRGGR